MSRAPERRLHILLRWPPRAETPEALADRLRRFMTLQTFDAHFRGWKFAKSTMPDFDSLLDLDEAAIDAVVMSHYSTYEVEEPRLAAFIADNVARDDFDNVRKNEGYGISGFCDYSNAYHSGLGGNLGASHDTNRFGFDAHYDGEPPSFLTYGLFKKLVLHAIDCWKPTFCVARANDPLYWDYDYSTDPRGVRRSPEYYDYANEGAYTKAWMAYVPPRDAPTVNLTGVPFSERTPDGGYLLSATNRIIDPLNPDDLAATRRIAMALLDMGKHTSG